MKWFKDSIIRFNLILFIVNLAFGYSFYHLSQSFVVRDKNNLAKIGVVNRINELYYNKEILLKNIPEKILTNETINKIKELSSQIEYSLKSIEWVDSDKGTIRVFINSYNIGQIYLDTIKEIETEKSIKLTKSNKAEYKTMLNTKFTKNLEKATKKNTSYSVEVNINNYQLWNNYIDIDKTTLFSCKISNDKSLSDAYLNNLRYLNYLNEV